MDQTVGADGSPVSDPKHRFFVPSEALASVSAGRPAGALVRLPADLSHQLHTVLRLRSGARVLLLDGQGEDYLAVLVGRGAEGVTARILDRRPGAGEPSLDLTL